MSPVTYYEVYVYRTLSECPRLTLPVQIVTIKGSQRLDKELNTWQIYKSISMIWCQGPFVHLAVWIIRRESVCWSERVRLLKKGVVSRLDLMRSNASQCCVFISDYKAFSTTECTTVSQVTQQLFITSKLHLGG